MKLTLLILMLGALIASAQNYTATAAQTVERDTGLAIALANANAEIDRLNSTRTNASPPMLAIAHHTVQTLMNTRMAEILDSYAQQAETQLVGDVAAQEKQFLKEFAKATDAQRKAARDAIKPR